MSYAKLQQRVILVTLIMILLTGCVVPVVTPVSKSLEATATLEPATPTSVPATPTPASPTATPPPPTPVPPTATTTSPASSAVESPQTGHWEGDRSISFEVTEDGHIRDFSIKLVFGLDSCTLSVEEITIEADNTFVFSQEISGDAGKTIEVNRVSGQFEDATTLSFTLGDTTMCGDALSFALGGQERIYKAAWQKP